MTVGSVDLGAIGRQLSDALPGQISLDEPLGVLTTYRVGGAASILMRAQKHTDLSVLTKVLGSNTCPIVVMGRGSNLLVADAGFPGLALFLEGDFEKVEVGEKSLRAGGAVPLPVLARRAAGEGRSGLEFFVGIPGSVGGAIAMNAGGHGRETVDVLMSADISDLAGDGVPRTRSPKDLRLGFRKSAIETDDVVVSAEFAVEDADPDVCKEQIAEIVRWRRDNQPGGANAGSVFKNPSGDAAGRLLDVSGLKGMRIGGASVSMKHANFIQADPGSMAADVRALIDEVRRRVGVDSGIDLEPEVRFLGFKEQSS